MRLRGRRAGGPGSGRGSARRQRPCSPRELQAVERDAAVGQRAGQGKAHMISHNADPSSAAPGYPGIAIEGQADVGAAPVDLRLDGCIASDFLPCERREWRHIR